MKFPGKRKSKHYFPVEQGGRTPFEVDFHSKDNVYIVGIEQLIVDIEIDTTDEFIKSYGIKKGESYVLADEVIEDIYQKCKKNNMIIGYLYGARVIRNYRERI